MRTLWLLALLGLSCSAGPSRPPRAYAPDRKLPKVIKNAAFAPLPLGSIKPAGWLKEQLQLQAAGLTGHIEEVWKDLGPDNGWKGGNGEGWERAPYYLDGLVPLAFELEDPVLLSKMQAWIDWNLEHQRPDGSIGPDRPRDWWPDMVFIKVMLQYGQASGDVRGGLFVDRWVEKLKRELPGKRLDAWRANRRYDEQARGAEDLVGYSDRWQFYRWQELAQSLLEIAAMRDDSSLIQLAKDLRGQGYDWDAHFAKFRFKEKTPRDNVFLANHGVNNAMGLRGPAMSYMLEGGEARHHAALEAWKTLHRYHGQANGAFSCDEQLAGLSPSQGTETCTVVEEMYSLESMGWMLGDSWIFDSLERLAYNALPAAMDESLWTHQYDQQVNQVLVSKAWRDFTSNKEEANLFGLEPEWGCCTANYHQGWPKFVNHLWMATPDRGLAAMGYAPCSVSVVLPAGESLTLTVGSFYPFRGNVQVKLALSSPEGAVFPIHLRMPGWATTMKVTGPGKGDMAMGRPGTFVTLNRRWHNGDEIYLVINTDIRVEPAQGGLSIYRGPILAALDLSPKADRMGGKAWSDTQLSTEDAWNLGLQLKPGVVLPYSVEDSKEAIHGNPYDRNTPPFVLSLKARRVKNWEFLANSAASPPEAPLAEGPEIEARLIPYGAAKLRISVFPALK